MQGSTANKVHLLDARYAGVSRQVDAMLELAFPLRTIAAALSAQYGEPISHAAIWRYGQESCSFERQRVKQECAAPVRGRGRLPAANLRSAAARNLRQKARSQHRTRKSSAG